jgi:xanthine dehydrogenase large subunit
VTATDTQKVANTSATSASTGSDLNGKAAEDAARQIRGRLVAFASERWGVPPADVCFGGGTVTLGDVKTITFQELIVQAYMARIQLWSDGFYATPGLSWDRKTMTGQPYYYFAYGAAMSEVVINTLTGEFQMTAAHVLHDAGRSLNPAIDIGQIEGAFMQGVGWLTSEELAWHPNDGSAKAGRLLTHAPSTYKIPTANDCPSEFVVRLWEGDNPADSIHRSKATGEPPLLLPFSVFFAIRDAVSAVGGHRADPPLDAPATPEAILRAVDSVRALALNEQGVRAGRTSEATDRRG